MIQTVHIYIETDAGKNKYRWTQKTNVQIYEVIGWLVGRIRRQSPIDLCKRSPWEQAE